MKVRTPDDRDWPVNWVSTAIMPDEIWLNMNAGENRIPTLAKSFDGCDRLDVTRVDGEATQTLEGYALLTHVMLDGGTITLRMRRREAN